VGEGTKMADHFSPKVRPAFPSSVIISERSSPSRVRFAAPNNGAPLTACGPFQDNTLRGGKGSLQTARWAGDHFAAILVPSFSATDRGQPVRAKIRGTEAERRRSDSGTPGRAVRWLDRTCRQVGSAYRESTVIKRREVSQLFWHGGGGEYRCNEISNFRHSTPKSPLMCFGARQE
jgi:hypothetical protein